MLISLAVNNQFAAADYAVAIPIAPPTHLG